MVLRGKQLPLVEGKKDRQIVLRLPEGLLVAVQQHRAMMQAAQPYERITLATATRDLLARALQPPAKRKRR